MMNTVVLIAGGNLGSRSYNLQQANILIVQNIGDIIEMSSIYETEPWGMKSEDFFLNQVFIVSTLLSANEVLKKIHFIEKFLGRIRKSEDQYISRTVDIDILFYNFDIIQEKDLQIPHPQISNRKFVLVALSEVMPDFIHPQNQNSIHQLLANCEDRSAVKKYFRERNSI